MVGQVLVRTPTDADLDAWRRRERADGGGGGGGATPRGCGATPPRHCCSPHEACADSPVREGSSCGARELLHWAKETGNVDQQKLDKCEALWSTNTIIIGS